MCYHQASKNATTQPAPSRKRQLDQASARRDMPATKELRGQDLNCPNLGRERSRNSPWLAAKIHHVINID